MMTKLFWLVYWTLVTLCLVAGLDNILFQLVVPGLFIGIVCLVMGANVAVIPLRK